MINDEFHHCSVWRTRNKTRYSKVKGMIFTLCPNYLSPKVNWGPGSDVNNAHSSNTV